MTAVAAVRIHPTAVIANTIGSGIQPVTDAEAEAHTLGLGDIERHSRLVARRSRIQSGNARNERRRLLDLAGSTISEGDVDMAAVTRVVVAQDRRHTSEHTINQRPLQPWPQTRISL